MSGNNLLHLHKLSNVNNRMSLVADYLKRARLINHSKQAAKEILIEQMHQELTSVCWDQVQ